MKSVRAVLIDIQVQAAANSRYERYRRLQQQRELVPNPDGRPPRIASDVSPAPSLPSQDYVEGRTDDRLELFDIPSLFAQLHPQHNPLPHDEDIDLGAQALSDTDWDHLQTWGRSLNKEQMSYYDRCKELWFDIRRDKHGICQRCIRRDHNQEEGPPLMSHENQMDPGPVPDTLPKLSDIEQMLIAPVHISMHMAHIKGAQYRYKGHIMTFLRDIPDVVQVLPRLPQHCQVVLIRPKQVLVDGTRSDQDSTRQFRRSFTVRRWAVQVRISLSMPLSYFD